MATAIAVVQYRDGADCGPIERNSPGEKRQGVRASGATNACLLQAVVDQRGPPRSLVAVRVGLWNKARRRRLRERSRRMRTSRTAGDKDYDEAEPGWGHRRRHFRSAQRYCRSTANGRGSEATDRSSDCNSGFGSFTPLWGRQASEKSGPRCRHECSSVIGRSHRWTGDHRTTAGCGDSTWNPAVSEPVRRRSRLSSRQRTPPRRPSSPRSADHAAGASDRDCDGDGGGDVGSKIGSRVPRRTRTTLPTARLHRWSRSMVVPFGLPLGELGK